MTVADWHVVLTIALLIGWAAYLCRRVRVLRQNLKRISQQFAGAQENDESLQARLLGVLEFTNAVTPNRDPLTEAEYAVVNGTCGAALDRLAARHNVTRRRLA